MAITDADYHSLLARMEKLEAKNRIWKAAGLLVLLALGFAVTANVTAQQNAPQAPVRATTVEAQTFLLTDTAGRVLSQLTVRDAKPLLELYDANGKVTWSTKSQAVHFVGR